METRRQAGLEDEQVMGAFVHAFLDDYWIVVTSGQQRDHDLAYKIVMEGFSYLGWTLSMSKFQEEGQLATKGILIGHHFDTVSASRTEAISVQGQKLTASGTAASTMESDLKQLYKVADEAIRVAIVKLITIILIAKILTVIFIFIIIRKILIRLIINILTIDKH